MNSQIHVNAKAWIRSATALLALMGEGLMSRAEMIGHGSYRSVQLARITFFFVCFTLLVISMLQQQQLFPSSN